MHIQTNLHAGENIPVDPQQLVQALQNAGVQVDPQQIQGLVQMLGSQVDPNQLSFLLSMYGINAQQVNQALSTLQQ